MYRAQEPRENLLYFNGLKYIGRMITSGTQVHANVHIPSHAQVHTLIFRCIHTCTHIQICICINVVQHTLHVRI